MAKEKTKEKKEKKDKKPKRSEEEGISKTKKEKKSKSHGKADSTVDTPKGATSVLNKIEKAAPGSVAVNGDQVKIKLTKDEDSDTEINVKKSLLVGAMVPFANPLADEKTMKKVLKSVKKSAKRKTLKRGVKEVVKALRKSSASSTSPPAAVVIIAADISPYDVISHIPVLCEDNHIPYIYVPSRAELGAAGSTKRPTSVVMVTPQEPKPKDGATVDADDKESWSDIYADLAKVVVKAGRDVRI